MNLSYPLKPVCLVLILAAFLASPVCPAAMEDLQESGPLFTGDPSFEEIPTYVHKKIYKKIWKEKTLDFETQTLCVGDFDGDGRNEVIATDGRRLVIVQWKYGVFGPLARTVPEKKGRFFSFWPWGKTKPEDLLQEINNQNRGTRYLYLRSGDFDGNGRDDVLFTGLKDQEFLSGILYYGQEGFSQFVNPPGLYMKIFRDREGAPVLVGQRLQEPGAPALRYGWNGTALGENGAQPLPGGLNLLTLWSYHSKGSPDTSMVAFSEEEGLQFFSSGPQGTLGFQPPGEPILRTVPFRMNSDSGKGKKVRYRIPQQLLTGDLDKDEQEDLLLILERPLLPVWGVGKAVQRQTVVSLALVDGHVLELWNTAPILGDILDMTAGDVDNNGKDELVLIIRKRSWSISKETKILIFKLE